MNASISISRIRPSVRRELRGALRDPGKDRDVLGQELAVIEDQRGDVALRVDLVEVAAVLGPLRP
jgi:hypothetical protein